jgi:hypothetical protein
MDYVGKFEKYASVATPSPSSEDVAGTEKEVDVGSRVISFIHAKAVAAMVGTVVNLAAIPTSHDDPARTGFLVGLVCSPRRISNIALADSG